MLEGFWFKHFRFLRVLSLAENPPGAPVPRFLGTTGVGGAEKATSFDGLLGACQDEGNSFGGHVVFSFSLERLGQWAHGPCI